MHKATFLEGTLRLTIKPVGPILIKAGESGGADPTLPDMEFVRTQGRIYIPGPSLKGVVRAHCERICRSLDSAERQGQQLSAQQDLSRDVASWLDEAVKQGRMKPEVSRRAAALLETPLPLADNPLGDKPRYDGLDDMQYSSGRHNEALSEALREYPKRTAVVYRRSSFVSQIFGHTSLAGRVRFADAYSDDLRPDQIEERNGVAIDRIYGSVAVGPFNYETVVGGSFTTRIDLKNLTLAQLGLLGLALRDLAEGRVAIGFGKSRGLGRVAVTFDELSLRYPTCMLEGGELRLLGGRRVCAADELAGLGALCAEVAYGAYNLPEEDRTPLPEGLAYEADEFLGVGLRAVGNEAVRGLWRACMPAWRRKIGL